MANVDRPNGLVPVRHMNGNPYNGASNMYYIPSTQTGAFFVGQPVFHTGTSGAAGVVVNGISVEGMPAVTSGSGGDPLIVGVIVGFLPNPASPQNKHRASSTAAIALVADDPQLIFEVQEDSTTSVLSAAYVGKNFDLTTESGSTTTGQSTVELDSDSSATTVLNVQVLRLVPRADNAIGTNARWEVRILEHMYLGSTGI